MVIIALLLIGLCLGSFTNAVVWRIHEQSKPKAKRKLKNKDELSISKGRSVCVHCGRKLHAGDLIPVLSWLSLRGKCRYCHKPISWQYPVVELVVALLFVGSYVFWPLPLESAAQYLQLGMWLVGVVMLVALIVYDIRWMLLPNRLVYPLIAAAVGVVLLRCLDASSMRPVFEGLLGVLFSAGLFYGLFQLSAGKWIGGGDVKLAVALGLLVGGAIEAVLMIFVASLLGSLVAIPAVIRGKASRTTKIPFGPFLILATIIVVLFGADITLWYETAILGL